MRSKSSAVDRPAGAPQRKAAIRRLLRDLRSQLSLLNRQVGARLELREIDHDCLDLIAREGPLSPSALAEKAQLHPATMTGVLDRLERAGWIARSRATLDRRAVIVTVQRERIGGVASLYAGMNGRLDRICADYTDAELDVIAGFMERVISAGASSTQELSG